MTVFEDAIATLGIPGSIAVVLVVIFAILQLIGEFIEACGKVAPVALKLRKVIGNSIAKKKDEAKQISTTLTDVKSFLSNIGQHYNEDNITKRDEWMTWVNDRAKVYDQKVVELMQLKNTLEGIVSALDNNTKMTEDMFKESCRDRIIDFASKVSDPLCPVSREEFNRIFRVYDKYEAFLAARNQPNGEVELNYQIIKEAYKERTETHNFIEDMRSMENK